MMCSLELCGLKGEPDFYYVIYDKWDSIGCYDVRLEIRL